MRILNKKRSLLIDELIHFSLALTAGGFLSLVFKNPFLILAGIAVGFLVDADHLFDYFYWAGAKFSLKDFLQPKKYVLATKKVFVLFHGWEYLIAFWFLGKYLAINLRLPGFEWTLCLPYFLHLSWDQIICTKNPFAYFLTYRIINKFSLNKFDVR